MAGLESTSREGNVTWFTETSRNPGFPALNPNSDRYVRVLLKGNFGI